MTGRGEMLETKYPPESSAPKSKPVSSNKDYDKQEGAVDILLTIIEKKDGIIQEQAEEIGKLRERVEQLECIKEALERPASGVPSSGLAGVG